MQGERKNHKLQQFVQDLCSIDDYLNVFEWMESILFPRDKDHHGCLLFKGPQGEKKHSHLGKNRELQEEKGSQEIMKQWQTTLLVLVFYNGIEYSFIL